MRILTCIVLTTVLLSRMLRADVIIENQEVRLAIGENGRVQSLLYKPNHEECLVPGANLPAFTAVLHRGHFPAKTVPATIVRREGNRLFVLFAPISTVVTLQLKVTNSYLGFGVENVKRIVFRAGENEVQDPVFGRIPRPLFNASNDETAPFDELYFLQLPLKPRQNYGAWMNVSWDEDLAVTLMPTDPCAKVDAITSLDGRVLRAAAVPAVRTASVGAALIVAPPGQLLEHVARLENDYGLPRGARVRMSPEARESYWELSEPVTLQNVDKVIAYAHEGGFRLLQFYYGAFSQSAGHFPWRKEYPNGMKDLQAVIGRLTAAGITAGFHIHYDKAMKNDPYVTPVPDRRLNLRAHFTLAASISATATEIPVLEDPCNSTLDQKRRILRFGDELIEYQSYTMEPPYRFLGCKRGVLGTAAAAHADGIIGGLLDVDNWPIFVRFNQETSLPDEVAARIAKIYHDADFKFVYFDGAEDVPPPFWFNIGRAQWRVYRRLNPEPLFCETSHLTPFNWHLASWSKAYDVVPAERVRELIRKRRDPEIREMRRNFTGLDFGWIRFFPPGEETTGMQPDIIEYVASHAAGWSCPISITGSLAELAANPRTADNFEVMRRWELARTSHWLTADQRRELRNLDQEYTLLINEEGKFELVPYHQIPVGDDAQRLRAFLFERRQNVCVVYWDMRGESRLFVPLPAVKVHLYRDLGKEIATEKTCGGVILPASERRYLEVTGMTPAEVEAAFARAKRQ